ncbi:DotA/TraY family protein [Gluconacetobacter tumulicola]|uniref:DotA/TraY family protein n=1 Tax=Gluconacetobacter tumulicola TaxID=1017177 RepID=A0A7W4P778_9PROT|nr:DotA/TraY family protein [Gluconacetobacter tumulicola]MBB2180131.1 DotA/TraY family protein [Gluconacetobacter tumulicola]
MATERETPPLVLGGMGLVLGFFVGSIMMRAAWVIVHAMPLVAIVAVGLLAWHKRKQINAFWRGFRGKTLMMILVLAVAGAGVPGARAADTVAASGSSSCQSSGSAVSVAFTLPCQDDIYRNLLENLFPDVTPLGTPSIISSLDRPGGNSNGTSALADAFQAFLSVLMSIAMAGLAWHVVSTLVSVAHEGTMLSQRWSVVWAPVRLFMGAGALAPFIKGYCVMQVAVLYLALWGGSLANVMWSAYLQGLTQPTISGSAIPNLNSVVKTMAVDEACRATLASAGGYSDVPGSTPVAQEVGAGSTMADISQEADYLWKWAGLHVLSSGSAATQAAGQVVQTAEYKYDFGPTCGSVTIDIPTGGVYSGYGSAELTALAKYMQTLAPMSRIAAQSVNVDGQQADQIPGELTELESGIQSGYTGMVADWGAAVNTLASSLNQGGSDTLTNWKDTAGQYGWATAGVYYLNVAKMQGMADSVMASARITIDGGRMTNRAGDLAGEVRALSSGASGVLFSELTAHIDGAFAPDSQETIKSVQDKLSAVSSAGNINHVTVNTNTFADAYSSNVFSEFLRFLDNGIGSAIGGLVNASGAAGTGDSGESELQAMTEFGQNLITFAWGIIGAMVVVWVGSKTMLATKMVRAAGVIAEAGAVVAAPETGGLSLLGGLLLGDIASMVGKLAGSALSVIWVILGALLFVGVLHAYVLPMMPYIHFTMFTMSMLIFVVEAMIAAPLWAFVHIRLDGQELIGQEQRTGYQLAFSLFLRAPLGMLGYFLSFAVFDAMVFLLRTTFYPAVASGTAESGGIIGTVVMVCMLSYLHWVIAIRSFSLISEVPDRVTRWFGGASVGSSEVQHAEGVKGFAGGLIARGIGQKVQGAGRILTAGRQDGQSGSGGSRMPSGGRRPDVSAPVAVSHGLRPGGGLPGAGALRSGAAGIAMDAIGAIGGDGMDKEALGAGVQSALAGVADGIESGEIADSDGVKRHLSSAVGESEAFKGMSRTNKNAMVQRLLSGVQHLS